MLTLISYERPQKWAFKEVNGSIPFIVKKAILWADEVFAKKNTGKLFDLMVAKLPVLTNGKSNLILYLSQFRSCS